jgi:Ca2+-binding RTX toxin-like protein
VLDGFAGRDNLLRGDGTDILIGGMGNDSLDGGVGDDVVDYTDAAAGFVNINLVTGKATGDGADSLTNIEDVIGSEGDDIFIGSAVGNEFTGGLGADRVSLGQDTAVDLLIYRAVSESLQQSATGSVNL